MKLGYRTFLLTLLGGTVFCTAMGVVLAHHQARQLFAELQFLERKRDRLDEQWERLQLERSTWAAHHRIEWIAREQLGMAPPHEESLILVKAKEND